MRILKIIILVLLSLIISIGSGVFMFYKSINNHTKTSENNKKNFNKNISIPTKSKNILFVGDASGLSDTIFIANFNPEKSLLNILSIPRDTYYVRPGFNSPDEKKINAAYSEEKIDGLKKAVEDLTGIQIDNFVILTYNGFKNIIDDVGGVQVNVPINMRYNDTAIKPPLHINLKKGLQTLDGEKALQFVRYRHSYVDGDIGRINAQQEFIKAFIKKISSPSIITKIPSLAITVGKNLKTDISMSDMTKYAMDFIKIKSIETNMAVLPGEGRYNGNTSYYFTDYEKALKLIHNLFGNTKISTSSIINNINTPNNKSITIEVLNGSNINGLATKYANKLKKLGFNVIKIGNINGVKYTNSRIYANDDKEKAKIVAKSLFISYIYNNKNIKSDSDVIVIIGDDKK